jgi:hypothetical protein
MKYLVYLFILMLVGCNEVNDYFETVNSTPELTVSDDNETFSSSIYDTAKIYENKTLYYKFLDEERLYINVSQSLNDDIVFGANTISITPETTGNNQICLNVKDSYGKTATATIYLYTFSNKIPVASLSVTSSSEYITIDASGSYDQDHAYGGYITRYYYTINGYVIDSNLSSVNYVFEDSGTKLIKLKVQDNDGSWSNEVSLYYYYSN